MKITIEWQCSYEAKLTVDGKEMKVQKEPGITKLTMADGSPVPESTFGGFIGEKLYGLIGDLMQAECIVAEDSLNDPGEDRTWETLDEVTMEEVQDRVF